MSWDRAYYASFARCPTLPPPLTKSKLAKKGFSYDSTSHQVVCSKCSWSTAQLQSLTEEILLCPHLTHGEKPYVPVDVKKPKYDPSPVEHPIMQASGLTRDFVATANDYSDVPHSPARSARAQPYREHGLVAIIDGPVPVSRRHTVAEVQFTNPVNRRRTFDGTGWPLSAPVSVDALVDAGFYYIGPGDRVRCAYCKKKIHLWEEGDDVAYEHKRISPFCQFAKDLQ